MIFPILYKRLIFVTLLMITTMLNLGNFYEVKVISMKNFEHLQAWFLEILNWEKYQNLIVNKDITIESIELVSKILHTEDEQKVLPIIVDKD